MLNDKGDRELAYIAKVLNTEALCGYDKVHLITVLGWKCVAPISIHKDDFVVYFEVDSLLPNNDSRFSFLASKKFRIKPIKICGVTSQGLALPLSDFPELKDCKEGEFVTEKLKVKLYEQDEYCNSNIGRSTSKVDGWTKAKDRHPILRCKLVSVLYNVSLFRKILNKLFIKKKDKITWPEWLPKTSQERIQNIPNLFDCDRKVTKLIITEKVDGMSSSYWIDKKNNYYVGSHNVVVYASNSPGSEKTADGNKYIKDNIWIEMSEKYDLRTVLSCLKKEYKLDTVAIQGESFGSGVQRRTYSKKSGEHDFVVFHILFNGSRVSMNQLVEICEKYRLPHVYIFDYNYELPASIDDVIKDIDSKKSAIDGGMIEGFVFYTSDCNFSFKCVSPNYLMKFHG